MREPNEGDWAGFAELHPPLSRQEALTEADRCLFCFEAPCVTACPTGIDIPLFIRQIGASNPDGAAKTIFDANIMGGMCARVCPTETLCEEVCVRVAMEGKPVRIGMLQRHATDHYMDNHQGQPYARAEPTGRRVAVVGAGPAGLSCAHRLAAFGHDVTVFDAREKPAGLNEYGIAAYKTVDGFAQREAAFILSIGGIEVRQGEAFGRDATLEGLRHAFDAVFLGMGLPDTNDLGFPGEDDIEGVEDAVAWIARLRQADDPRRLGDARRVVVVGGGMTAVDAAVQSKLLGAEEVTIVYRRGQGEMPASGYEQDLAKTKGVVIRHWARPSRLLSEGGRLVGVAFERTAFENGVLAGTGETFVVPADRCLKAIGQTLPPDPLAGVGLELEGGRIRVDAERRTSVDGVWAGGDCARTGRDLTVQAVEDGKIAARSIDRALRAASQ
ncbi:MAG: NAD(P)-dependent oxidoreductase [Geminicoccaceae bacterium]|nr:NAD(P)-dependent oxidoreductase [Geminicoccaceae bacterium]